MSTEMWREYPKDGHSLLTALSLQHVIPPLGSQMLPIGIGMDEWAYSRLSPYLSIYPRI
jgi:hypothetical protein